MNLYWPFYIRRSYKVHVFSILYGHINVPMAFKELTNYSSTEVSPKPQCDESRRGPGSRTGV